MNIAAAINGNLISEKCAEYALFHAKAIGAELVVFFIKNKKDAVEDVNRSYHKIEALAKSNGVDCRFKLFDESLKNSIDQLIETDHVGLIYCSTRAEKSFFEFSFSERIVQSKPNCDVAVVKITNLKTLSTNGTIGLYARNQSLSTEVYTLAAAIGKNLGASLGIFTNINKKKQALLDLPFTKQQQQLRQLDINILPYTQLSKLIGIECEISRIYEDDLKGDHLAYLISRYIDVLVLEAYKWPMIPLSIKNPTEELFKQTPVNCIVYYPEH